MSYLLYEILLIISLLQDTTFGYSYEGCDSSNSSSSSSNYCFASPQNCIENENCDMLVKISANLGKYEYKLEMWGKASEKDDYVAFGLSKVIFIIKGPLIFHEFLRYCYKDIW